MGEVLGEVPKQQESEQEGQVGEQDRMADVDKILDRLQPSLEAADSQLESELQSSLGEQIELTEEEIQQREKETLEAILEELSDGGIYLDLVPMKNLPSDPQQLHDRILYTATLMRLNHWERNEKGGIDVPQTKSFARPGKESEDIPFEHRGVAHKYENKPDPQVVLGRDVWYPILKLRQKEIGGQEITQKDRNMLAIKISWNLERAKEVYPSEYSELLGILGQDVINLLGGSDNFRDIYEYTEAVLQYYFGDKPDNEMLKESYPEFPPTIDLEAIFNETRERQETQGYSDVVWGDVEDAVNQARSCTNVYEAVANADRFNLQSHQPLSSRDPATGEKITKSALDARTESVVADIWWIRARQLGAQYLNI